MRSIARHRQLPMRINLLVAVLVPLLGGVWFAPTTPPVAAQSTPLVWERLADPDPALAPRWDHTLSWDAAGDRLILLGGRDAAGAPLGDAWVYDIAGASWSPIAGDGPSPRFGHAVAIDRETLYLFGGQADGATFFDDTWALDLASLTWRPVETGDGPRPAPRYGTSAVLDDRGWLLVSHGFTFEGRFDDTWALDPATGRWTDLSPAPETRPLKRCLHEAVWDATSARMLLFGGCSSGFGPCPQGDLWAFDPAAGTWTELTPLPSPVARSNPALVIDETGGRALLLGGLTADGPAIDLWSLLLADPVTWTPLMTSEGPTPRSSHDLVRTDDGLYLIGGTGASGPTADLWRLPLPTD